MRWAKRSYEAFENIDLPTAKSSAIFGIVQGGVYRDLREESLKSLTDIPFDGYAIGGLAVGEGQDVMFEVLDFTMPHMPTDKPRYLMGVGKPDDIVGAVARGIDMFDCVLPTRSGRNAQAFTRRGTVNLKNARHQDDPRPLDDQCACNACQRYSRAYLSHLIRSGEILGAMLLTEHNLQYYQDLMSGLRNAIEQQKLSNFINDFHKLREVGDIPPL